MNYATGLKSWVARFRVPACLLSESLPLVDPLVELTAGIEPALTHRVSRS